MSSIQNNSHIIKVLALFTRVILRLFFPQPKILNHTDLAIQTALVPTKHKITKLFNIKCTQLLQCFKFCLLLNEVTLLNNKGKSMDYLKSLRSMLSLYRHDPGFENPWSRHH